MTRLGVLAMLLGAGCTKLFGLDHVPAPPDAPPAPAPEPGGTIAAGFYASCALHPDATAWCWGRNIEYEVQSLPASEVHAPVEVGTATYRSIAARSTYACGVHSDGSLWCWGMLPKPAFQVDVEKAPVEVDPGPVTAAHLGVYAMCKLDGAGEIECRGNNVDGQLGDGTQADHDAFAPIAQMGPWMTMTVGYAHACAIKLDGSLWCWGLNGASQLALPDPSPVTAPKRVGDELWSDVSGAFDATCGITQSGHLRCWGGNTFGQLGNGTTTFSSLPTPVVLGGVDMDGWVRVRAGWDDHVCALRTDGSLWCWGHSAHGEAGVDGAYIVSAPQQVPGTWKDVAAGYLHTCAVRDDDSVWCFGSDGFGQLGDGGTSATTPQQIAGTWKTVSVRGDHTCAIDSANQLSCAGQNDHGPLGDGTQTSHQSLTSVPGTWAAVDVGEATTCGLQGTTAYCWGRNDHGQLGLGDTAQRLAPVQVATNVSAIATTAQSCKLSAGSAYCWGLNDRGQVGDGSKTDRTAANLAVGGALAIDGGTLHTCMVASNTQVECWGGATIVNGATATPTGALGQGADNADHLTPVTVAGTTGAASVVTGWYDTCEVDSTHVGRCWGLNSSGELGVGDAAIHSTPSALPSTWNMLALGLTHGCGIRNTDMSLWCWGANDRGQRGDPGATSAAATQVMPGHTWTRVVAGEYHTCAIETAGGLWCWGANDDGQLANGAAWRASPVHVQ